MIFDNFLREKLWLITFLVLKKMMLEFLWDADETDLLRKDADKNGFFLLFLFKSFVKVLNLDKVCCFAIIKICVNLRLRDSESVLSAF